MVEQTNKLSKNPYISIHWEQLRDIIEHTCQFSSNILAITGPKAAGKTTFINYFANYPLTRIKKHSLDGASINANADIFNQVNAGFNVVSQDFALDKRVLQNAIKKSLASNAYNCWVLLVDNADLIPIEQLQVLLELVNFDVNPRKQLHLVLFGGKVLKQRLQTPDFQAITQGRVQSIDIEPWSLQDVKAAIKSQNNNIQLDERSIATIYQRSKGWPGAFHQELASVILSKQKKGLSMQKIIPPKEPSRIYSYMQKISQSPVLMGVFLGAVLGIGFLTSSLIEEEEWADSPNNVAMIATNEDDPLAKTTSTKSYGYSSEEELLLLSNSRNYTLELIHAKDELRAREFIQKHDLSGKANLFRTKKKGRDDFVVVYGQYTNASKALAALDKMPDSLHRDRVSPQVRELRSIQDEIRSRREG